MITVHKFPVPLLNLVKDEFTLVLPARAEVLTVQTQGPNADPFMWIRLDTDGDLVPRRFRIAGTGHPLPTDSPDRLPYVGTFQLDGGAHVFHLFEVRP